MFIALTQGKLIISQSALENYHSWIGMGLQISHSPRVKSSIPVRGNSFAEFMCSNTILASLPE